MLSTTQLRAAWGPPCQNSSTRVTIPLNGEGRITVDKRTRAAFEALDACLRAHGYRTRRNDTGAYNCRRITGGNGYSLHAYSIAADLNWQTNPYGRRLVTDMPPQMRADIKAIRTRNGRQVFGWGGDYRTNKDAMHWEIVCSPKDLATGIDPRTVPGYKPPAPANPGKWQQFAKGATDAAIHAKGGRDNQVSELQMLLKMLGFYRATVDGAYGPITTSAVIAAKDAYRWPDRSSLIDAPFMLKLRTLAMER